MGLYDDHTVPKPYLVFSDASNHALRNPSQPNPSERKPQPHNKASLSVPDLSKLEKHVHVPYMYSHMVKPTIMC